jgi:anti-sigma-K factor RskA
MTEREVLAAEIALRLLEEEDLDAAMADMASDPELAELVHAWEQRLAPMAQVLLPVQPLPETWPRIAAALTPSASASNDNEPLAREAQRLRARLRRWQWGSVAAAATALVIGLLGAPFLQPGQQPSQPPLAPAEAPLFASLPVGGPEGPRLDLTYLPQSGDLVVLAGGVAGDGVHDHELWLVAPDTKPISIGVIASGQERRVHVPAAVAARIGAGLGVVLTREPLGGAPPGGSAGPVVAEGIFAKI